MNKTAIQWTDETWNPTTGCTKVSAGCDHCYAQTLHNQRYRANVKAALALDEPGEDTRIFYRGLVSREHTLPMAYRGGGNSDELPFPATYDTPFAQVQCHPERLPAMLRKRSLAGKRVFVNSMSDLFHEQVPTEFIDQVFAVMARRPDVIFQVLTKRPERMREYLADVDALETRVSDIWWTTDWQLKPEQRVAAGRDRTTEEWPLSNVWLGVSVEDQWAANERIPVLLGTPAAVRFLSCEPLLGPVDLERWLHDSDCWMRHQRFGGDLKDFCECNEPREDIHWVIAGGESGKGARPADLAWFRSIRDQCRAAGVAYFCKQLGARPIDDRGIWPAGVTFGPIVSGGAFDGGFPVRLRDRHGGDWDEWPTNLRVREFPS